MRSGLHALNLGLQKTMVALVMAAAAALFVFATFIVVLVAIEAAQSFGQ
jgi:hypothetical protein